jgi:hypothetical protein
MLLLKVIKYVPMPKKIKDAVKKALNLTKKIKAPCHMEIHANEATLRGWNDGTFSYESNTTAYLEGLLGLCKSVLNPIADAGGLGGSAVLPIEAKTWRLWSPWRHGSPRSPVSAAMRSRATAAPPRWRGSPGHPTSSSCRTAR